MKKLLYYFICTTIIVALFASCKAKELTPEQKQATEALTQKIEDGEYTFTPRQITPMRGKSKHLDSGYYIKVDNKSVKVDLPYFGRIYSAPADPQNISIKLTSNDFEYMINEKKIGQYEIRIKPNDIKGSENKGIIINVSASISGYATVTVLSNNREQVSYYGTIE